jgi:hypothetical protein
MGDDMPFTARLVTLSPGWLFFLINVVFVLISAGLLCLVRCCVHYQTRRCQNDVTASIFNKAGAIFGIIIAFVVVILWQEYNKSKDNSVKEGNAALELYQDLNLYPNRGEAAKSIKSLGQFAKLVVEDEYPAMAQMRMSQATEQALTDLRNDIHHISPTNPREQILYTNILKDFKTLASLRHDRLSDMESSLPNIFWIVLITGSVVGLLFAMLLGTEKFWLHLLMTSMLAIIIANAFYLIIELDYPFMGSLSAKPTSYIKMIEIIGGR